MKSIGKRINWIDFGKGFAIFSVLVGHVLMGLYESNIFSIANDVLLLLITQIYIFHIPVFFALSGYFFRPVSDMFFIQLFTFVFKRSLVPLSEYPLRYLTY